MQVEASRGDEAKDKGEEKEGEGNEKDGDRNGDVPAETSGGEEPSQKASDVRSHVDFQC
jgi:hypothetical protein